MRPTRLHHFTLPLAAALLLTWLAAGDAARLDDESRAATGEGRIQLNFRDVEIVNVIRVMSELTGKNFLLDGNVRGRITLMAPQPVSAEKAYEVLLSILEIQGFSVVPQGSLIKIVPTAEIRDNPIPTATEDKGALPQALGDAYVTQLIPLEFADVNQVRGLLSPLVSEAGALLSHLPTNTLILTETAANIARLRKILTALDVKAQTKLFRVIPLQHAGAGELAASVQAALQGLAETTAAEALQQQGDRSERRRRRQRSAQATARAASGPTVIADLRTNALVVIATAPDMQAAEDLIAKLDVPTPAGRGRIHVYYLSYADAEELAEVLTAHVPQIARLVDAPGGEEAQQSEASRETASPATGRTPRDITITADQATNSLVIAASPESYAVIEDTIRKLDIRRSQVLVEGLIAEVTLDTARELGIEWRVIDQPDGTQVFAGSTGTVDGTGILANPAALLSTPGFVIGALRNTIRLGSGDEGQQLLNIPLLLRAFRGNSNVEVLATPNLLTTDNEEAEIVVGEQRPFLTSVNRIPDAGIVNVSNTFDFRDTGITLRILPQISQGKRVRTELNLEITRFVSEAEVGAVTTTKRSTRTTVIVDDGQTIVLGGLIQDARDEADTGVPLLSGLPLLGGLFRQSAVRSNKTNLLIFLTPHIINTRDDADRVSAHKQQQAERPEPIQRRLLEGRPQFNLEWLLD